MCAWTMRLAFAPAAATAHSARRPRTSAPRCSVAPDLSVPPVRNGRVSHAAVLLQAAAAVSASSSRLLTVDFPPERSESRSGTLVARYENNLNFAEKLLNALGATGPSTPIGGAVLIRDNVNPQGGGEYLDDDEVLTGLRGAGTSIVLNAGVDAATLRGVRDLDDGGRIILLNCALDRVSWLARRGMRGAIDGFTEAYYLKVIAGAGVLLKCAPSPWRAFVPARDGFQLVLEAEQRPKMGEVEAAVRAAAMKQRGS